MSGFHFGNNLGPIQPLQGWLPILNTQGRRWRANPSLYDCNPFSVAFAAVQKGVTFIGDLLFARNGSARTRTINCPGYPHALHRRTGCDGYPKGNGTDPSVLRTALKLRMTEGVL